MSSNSTLWALNNLFLPLHGAKHEKESRTVARHCGATAGTFYMTAPKIGEKYKRSLINNG
jgi:hypothetical protein